MNLFFNGQDTINLKSVSQINFDTSFQCPALKSDATFWSEKITGTCFPVPFKLEYGIIHYRLKNKPKDLHFCLAESKISSVTIFNNQLTTLKWHLTPSPPCRWAVGAAGGGNNRAFSTQHRGLLTAGKNLRYKKYAWNWASPADTAIWDIKSVTGTEQTASHCTYGNKRYYEKSIYSHCYTFDKLFPPPCTMDI